MKNMKKLVALFAAATMAMSMSISAFAEVVAPTISTDKLTLNIGTGITTVNGDQTTMMAYVVPGIITEVADAPDYTGAEGQEIVALDQVDGETGIASVPVDADKLADGNTIVVKISGTDGNLATYLIAMEAPVVTYTVTYNLDEGTVEGTNATSFTEEVTIAKFFETVVAPAKDGYNFTGWTDESGAAVNTESTDLMSTLDANADKTVALTATYEQVAGSDPVIVVIGDVDGDGDADLDDAIAIKSKLIGGSQQIEGAPYAIGGMITDVIYCGDVDGDKDADLDDAIAIKSKLIGGSQQIEGAPYAIGESVQIEK